MSQSQGIRECWGQRGLPGAQHQGGGGRTVDPLSRGPFLCPGCHALRCGVHPGTGTEVLVLPVEASRGRPGQKGAEQCWIQKIRVPLLSLGKRTSPLGFQRCKMEIMLITCPRYTFRNK